MERVTLVVIALFVVALIVALISIFWSKALVYEPITNFISIFTTEKRCDYWTASEYERAIVGYEDEELYMKAHQLCKRYKGCFSEKFGLFVKKNEDKEYCKRLDKGVVQGIVV